MDLEFVVVTVIEAESNMNLLILSGVASRYLIRVLSPLALVCSLFLVANTALGESHAFIQSMRSSSITHVLISQSIEGEFGKVDAAVDAMTNPDGTITPSETESKYWQGYNSKTAIGLELMKFIQFKVAHTFVNLKQKNNSLENLRGSRLHGEFGLVFGSPLGNLEAGVGMLGAKLDYQRELESATFYGSGFGYYLGINYFISTKVSFFGQINVNEEHLVRNGGYSIVNAIDTSTSGAGLGFRIWM